MMFICTQCGAIFTEPDERPVRYPYGEAGAVRYEGYCPNCGSDDIADAHKCSGCGNYFAEDELDYMGEYMFCESCQQEVVPI